MPLPFWADAARSTGYQIRFDAFGAGHAQASGRPEGQRPAASGSTIWAFEVVQASDGQPSDAQSSGVQPS